VFIFAVSIQPKFATPLNPLAIKSNRVKTPSNAERCKVAQYLPRSSLPPVEIEWGGFINSRYFRRQDQCHERKSLSLGNLEYRVDRPEKLASDRASR
jgi:hypothetical protein